MAQYRIGHKPAARRTLYRIPGPFPHDEIAVRGRIALTEAQLVHRQAAIPRMHYPLSDQHLVGRLH